MNTSDKITIAGIIVGVVINVIMGLFNAAVAWLIYKKISQATLQNAQPIAKPRRRKVLGPKQRRILKGLRLVEFISACTVFNCIMDSLQTFLYPGNRTADMLLLVSALIAITAAIWGLIYTQRLVRSVKDGNRAIINDLAKAFQPRTIREVFGRVQH